MRTGILLLLFGVWGTFISVGQTIRTIGAYGADYPTLKDAFDAVNNGIITGDIVIQVVENTSESITASLNASGSGAASYSSVLIFPATTGKSITGNLNSPLIRLNGADHVTIDGRINQTGPNDLTISNSSTGTGSSTIDFTGSASYNTVKYCLVKGATKNTSGGVIMFSPGTTTGNLSNQIDHCAVTMEATGKPIYLIHSVGSNGKDNISIITNNNLYDNHASSGTSYAIMVSFYNTGWVISGNSIYQTLPVVSAAATLGGIFMTSGSGHTVSNNYIGGGSPECGNPTWSISGSAAIRFIGMNLTLGTTAASNVYNNVISNMTWNSTSGAITIPGLWAGIYIQTGTVNVGTMGGNTIGSATGTGNISINTSSGGVTAGSYGILTATSGFGNLNISNNTIGSITVSNTYTSSGSGHRFFGIWAQYGGQTIHNNTIGSSGTEKSIHANNAQGLGKSNAFQDVIGIYSNSVTANNINITSNSVQNLHNAWLVNSASGGITRGIQVTSGTGNHTVSGNTIRKLSTMVPLTGTGISGAIGGILHTASTAGLTVSNNFISELSHLNAGACQVQLTGIMVSGNSGNGRISSNKTGGFVIFSIATSGCGISGIQLSGGNYLVDNNQVSITNASNTNCPALFGIRDEAGSASSNNYYFNSVLIAGSQQTGVNINSYGFFRGSGASNIIKNNIFVNVRSGSIGTGKHFSIGISDPAGSVTLDNNDYFADGTNGVPGLVGTNEITALPVIQGQDGSSFMVDPAYNSMDDLHSTQGELNNQGVSVPGISTDLEGVIRTDPPDIGAYEFSLNSVVETGLTPLTISTVSATLQGTVDPRNETVSGTFEYGLTTEYGNSGNWSPAVLTGIGSQAVTTTITGLIPNCLYHYRVTGSTSAGTVHGMDRSFQTSEASATSFTGSNSGQWGDPANWDNGVPGTLTDVLIPAEKLAVVDNSSACHNLTIAANGALTVNSGKNLVISGALNILSDIGGTGSLIADVNGLTQTGITTVQRYLNGASEAWHLLSSPVAGQQISGEFTPSGTYPDGSGYDFYLWQEASETWMNRKAATWQAANGGNSFAAGRGYLVAYQESNPVKTFSGLLFSGEITIPLTNAGVLNYRRHNLVGNPYPSAIDWKSAPGIIKDDLEMEPGGGHNFYVYNSLTGNYGVYSDAAIGDEGTNGTGRYIPAMQGFFIKAKPGVPVTGLTISDEARVHAAAMFLKQSEPDRIRLNVTAQDGTGSDEVILEFGHNDDLGGAGKWFSINPDAPSLYTAKDGVKYAISFLSTAGNQPFAALNFKPGKSANYCLRASGTNGVNTDFILEDMVAGINIDFSLQQEYLFSARNSDRDDRFHIHFKSTGLVHSNSAAPVSFRYQRGVLVVCGQFPGEKLKGEIEVYDLPGKLVQKNVIDGVSPVGIGLLVTPGVLIVRGVINGTLVTGKVVPANICPTSF